jgi:ammonia channel protein AmtB
MIDYFFFSIIWESWLYLTTGSMVWEGGGWNYTYEP